MSETKETKKETPFLLQKRDQQFLLDLYDLQFLDMEYLTNNMYSTVSKSYIYKRIKMLEQEGYIQVFRVPLLDLKNGQSKHVYCLGKEGSREVGSILGECDWRYDTINRVPSHVYHQLLLSHVKAAFEERQVDSGEPLIPKNETYEMVQYLNEKNGYYKYDPKTDPDKLGNETFTIRPDGVLVLRNKKTNKYLPFFLELERSRQSKQTTMEKLERYNLYCQYRLFEEKHRGYDYPVMTPRIIFISYKEGGIDRLLKHSKNVDTSSTNGVLFTTYENIINDPYGQIFFGKDSTNPEQLYTLKDKIE